MQRGAPAVYASKALGQASRVHWHPPNTRLCLALHQEPRSDNLWSASPPLHAVRSAQLSCRNIRRRTVACNLRIAGCSPCTQQLCGKRLTTLASDSGEG